MIRTIGLIICSVVLTGCATQLSGDRYLNDNIPFDLFAFFEGDVTAWGLVQNRRGEVVQRFRVDIRGTVTGDQLRLDESFSYLEGNGVDSRVWNITRLADGIYTGSASDIEGPAQGFSYGGAFRWTYAMDLPVGGNVYHVNFDDWIFSMGPDQIMNRSWIQKFGLDVAEVTIFMTKST